MYQNLFGSVPARLFALVASVGCAGDLENRTTDALARIEQRYEREQRQDEAAQASETRGHARDLAYYLAQALRHSPRARAAFERWKAATLKIARARRLPEPQLRYAFFVQSVETRVGPQRHRFGLSQTFPWPTRLSRGSEALASEAAAAEQAFDAVVLELRQQVAQAFWELWLVHEIHRLKAEHDLVLETLAETTRGRVATNQATLADLNQVELIIARHHDHNQEHHELAHATTARLYALVGLDPEAPVVGVDAEPVAALPAVSTKRMRELAKAHPYVVRHELLEEASRAQADAQSADRFPSFMVGADYVEVGPARNPGVPDSGKDAFSVSLGVSLPLWQASVSDAEDAALAQARAHRADREHAERLIEAELAAALAEVRNSERKIRLYRDALIPQAIATYQSVLGGYQTGRSSIAATLLAQGELLELGLELARQRGRHAQSWAKLESVIGQQIERREQRATKGEPQ